MNPGKELLFEIGTEELPPSCIDEGVNGLKAVLGNKLSENRLEFGNIQTYSSPRRLVAVVDNLSCRQKSEEKVITGPPARIAFDSNGSPTEAAKGFAKSLNLKVSDLEKIEIEGKGLYLGKKIIEEGKRTRDILGDILKDTILSLTFSKQMSWADYDIKFARPIRWILALYDNEIVNFSIANLNSGNVTFGHRMISPDPIVVKNSKSYFNLLEDKGKVIADAEKRKKIILNQIKKLEEKVWKSRFKVVLDEDLLKDVVNLVEIPNVIVGNFPGEFLYIPKELLIEAIQHHQKYFAVLDSSGNVSTNFIIVQNGIEDEGGVKKGNERVLKARLSDAAYFYEEDKKHDFNYWTDKLKGVIFYSGLGSMYDKAVRLKEISLYIIELLKETGRIKNSNLSEGLARASMLCKCDLVTNMVVEFPSLQGIVGREYARERGEKVEISDAVFEHYLPRFAGDILPKNDVGLILSIADKIDTIAGMFLAGEVPSGSEDPFALRRKASGIVLSVLKGKYDFSLDKLINYSLKLYFENINFKYREEESSEKSKLAKDIKDFIMARFRFMLEKEGRRLDILESILAAGCSSILDISLRYNVLEEFIKSNDIKKIYFPMVRCRNILGREEITKLNPELFKEEYEKKLFSSLIKEEDLVKNLIHNKDYKPALLEIYEFGEIVDIFFDKVLVMDKDNKIKSNRISLVKRVLDLYFMLADFSKLMVNNS